MPEPDHGVDDVFDVYEIPHLSTISVFLFVRLEELDLACTLDLLEALMHHASHVALVVFVGPVDVEEAETRNFFLEAVFQDPDVEIQFGLSVRIERLEFGRERILVGETLLSGAVSAALEA